MAPPCRGTSRQRTVAAIQVKQAITAWRRTPKKSRSWLATTATANQEKAFCQGRLMVQSMTSATVIRPLVAAAPLPPTAAVARLPSGPPLPPPASDGGGGGSGLLLLPLPPAAAAAAAEGRRCTLQRRCTARRLHCCGQGAAGRAERPHSRTGPPCCCPIVETAIDAPPGALQGRVWPASTQARHPQARRGSSRSRCALRDGSKRRAVRRPPPEPRVAWRQTHGCRAWPAGGPGAGRVNSLPS